MIASEIMTANPECCLPTDPVMKAALESFLPNVEKFFTDADKSGDASGKGNAVYQFTLKGKRSTFASGQAYSETFSHIALQPMPVCCQ